MGHRTLSLQFLLLLFFASCFPFTARPSGVLAAWNVTIDESDPSILYSPPEWWGLFRGTGYSNGTYMWVTYAGATATFSFTGIAIYIPFPWVNDQFLGSRWAGHSRVSLDSAVPVLLDFSPSNPTGPQGIVWSEAGLENKRHTLQISADTATPYYALIDGLMYTTLDPPPPITSASATSIPCSPSRKDTIAAALGAVFGILGLAIILSTIWYFLRGQDRGVVFSNLARKGTKCDSVHDELVIQPASGQQMQHGEVIPRYGPGVMGPPLPPIPPITPLATHFSQSLQTPAFQNQREANITFSPSAEGPTQRMPRRTGASDEAIATNFT